MRAIQHEICLPFSTPQTCQRTYTRTSPESRVATGGHRERPYAMARRIGKPSRHLKLAVHFLVLQSISSVSLLAGQFIDQ